MPIQILSPDVAAKIAAGEVVERPASVAKELIENALDAGATQVNVEVSGGGLRLIRVTDNGCGIPPEGVELAFERYATSKISAVEDLSMVTSLGFRGEALASIASVAEVHLITRTAEELAGTYLRVRYGKPEGRVSRAAPPGTTVAVQNLFRNVPARLKFVRSFATEAGRIGTLVGLYSLAFPEVKFALVQDGRQTQASSGNGSLREQMAPIYGREVAEGVLEVDTEEQGVRVWGLVGNPALHRASRNYIHLLVNRRPVQSRPLSHAILEAYEGLLMTGRFPLAVLNIHLSPEEVDVNVHPTKAEVKFQKESLVFATVKKAVRSALLGQTPVPLVRSLPQEAGPRQSPQPIPSPTRQEAPKLPMFAPSAGVEEDIKSRLPLLRVLGQVANTYIVAEGPNGMYLIDQHTAHERAMFDKLRRQLKERRVEVQALLETQVVELSSRQEAVLQAERDALEAYGFHSEPFGQQAYLLRAVPAVLSVADPTKAFLDALDYLGSDEAKNYDWQERTALSLVCHNVVRAGKVLSMPEMEELVRLLEQADVPQACPHGRPTTLHLSQTQLEREFGRR